MNTTPFSLNDPVFANVSNLVTQAEIDLINSSSLLLDLLHQFIDSGCELEKGDRNAYIGNAIELNVDGTNFVRLLSR